MPDIVTISGTCRPDNYTSRVLGVVNDALAERGSAPTVFDACDLTLGFPGEDATDDAKRLQEAVEAADGIVLATPEYHGTFAAMTKLVIENLGFPSRLAGKPIALVGCAAGRIGAVKSLEHLRGVCAHTGAIVMPLAVSIAGVRNVFDESGACIDEGSASALRGVADDLLEFIREYVRPKRCLEEMVRQGTIEPWATNA